MRKKVNITLAYRTRKITKKRIFLNKSKHSILLGKVGCYSHNTWECHACSQGGGEGHEALKYSQCHFKNLKLPLDYRCFSQLFAKTCTMSCAKPEAILAKSPTENCYALPPLSCAPTVRLKGKKTHESCQKSCFVKSLTFFFLPFVYLDTCKHFFYVVAAAARYVIVSLTCGSAGSPPVLTRVLPSRVTKRRVPCREAARTSKKCVCKLQKCQKQR